MIVLTNNKEREEISRIYTRYLATKDKDLLIELGEFGVEILKATDVDSGDEDCAAYALAKLGIQYYDGIFQDFGRETRIQSMDELKLGVDYFFRYRGEGQIKNNAIRFDDRLESKWHPSIVARHAIDKVPIGFGFEVLVYEITDKIKGLAQFRIQGYDL